MKILYFANGFPPEIGGTEVFNSEITRQLSVLGHSLEVVTWSQDLQGNGGGWPFPVHRISDELVGDHYDLRGLDRIVEAFSPDVAVVSRTSRRLRKLFPYLKKKRLEYVSFCHFIRTKHQNRDSFRQFFARKRFGFDGASLVLGVSRFLAGQLEEIGVDPSRIRVLCPGVDSQYFRPSAEDRERVRKALGINGNTVLLTVARLIDGKGQDRVLRVLPQLLRKDPKLVYLIVGGGPNLESLRAIVKERKLENSVKFLGPTKTPLDYYRAADIFVMPSNNPGRWYEAYSLALLEAASCALPTVACKPSGAQEVVVDGQTGFLVDQADESNLRHVLEDMVLHPELRQTLGRQGREQVAKKRVWSDCARILEGYLLEIQPRRDSSPAAAPAV